MAPGGNGRPRDKNVLLERGILAAQPRDLVLQERAILGRRLAGQAHGLLTAQRDLAGLGIEPDETVGLLVEDIAAALAVRCRVSGMDRRGQSTERRRRRR